MTKTIPLGYYITAAGPTNANGQRVKEMRPDQCEAHAEAGIPAPLLGSDDPVLELPTPFVAEAEAIPASGEPEAEAIPASIEPEWTPEEAPVPSKRKRKTAATPEEE
jgi:hypothetical protein